MSDKSQEVNQSARLLTVIAPVQWDTPEFREGCLEPGSLSQLDTPTLNTEKKRSLGT